MAIGGVKKRKKKFCYEVTSENGEPRISAGKEATRWKRKEHKIGAVKPALVAVSAANKDSHSKTEKASREQQQTKIGKTGLRF